MMQMSKSSVVRSLLILVAGVAAYYWLLDSVGNAHELDPPRPAPAFTQQAQADWLNSPPLAMEDLRGRVVLVHFWAFSCWNCYKSFPWLNALEDRHQDDGLRIIGVHTPEFDREKDAARIKSKTQEFNLDHPIMLDNDMAYWHAMNNRYWPTYYLIDKQGQIRAYFIGETHKGDHNAQAIEDTVKALLTEKA